MLPAFVTTWVERSDGSLASHYAAYKAWRWGEPHVRLIGMLCDRSLLSVDVGAHSGLYTYFMRRASRRCVAFEPNPALAAGLKRRFGHTVTVHQAAVSEASGTLVLRIPSNEPGLATVEPANPVTGAEAIEVPVVTLDDMISDGVGFVKIDVEGHEMSVFRGAERLLDRWRPNLLVELEDRHRPGITQEAFDHLAARGYRGWFISGDVVEPTTAFDPVRHRQRGRGYVGNFVFSQDARMGARMARRLG